MSPEVRQRAALRAARRSPRLPDAAVAAAAGSGMDLSRASRSLRYRGVCAQRLADIAAGPRTGLGLLALSHRLCPPAATAARLATGDPLAGTVTNTNIGTAADPFIGSRSYAMWPSNSDETLRRLAQRPYPQARAAAAQHPRCSPSLLQRLVFDPDPHVRAAVAEQPRCPHPALRALASDPEKAVRGSVAANPACPSDMLTVLAASEDTVVRGAAATNPRCPPGQLAVLIVDDSDYVRSGAAANPACPSDMLERFAAENSLAAARRAAAVNPSSPARLLERLAAHPGRRTAWTVLEAVAANPNCSVGVLKALTGIPVNPGEQQAENPARVRDNLDDCAVYTGAAIRAAAAANPSCTPQMLHKISETSTDPDVLAAVVANPSTPAETFESLVADGRHSMRPHRLRAAAAANPSCPPHVLQHFAEDPEDTVRAAAAANPDCPPPMLARLAADSSNQTRAAAAANPSLPADQLKALAHDVDPLVADTVAQRLRPVLPDPRGQVGV